MFESTFTLDIIIQFILSNTSRFNVTPFAPSSPLTVLLFYLVHVRNESWSSTKGIWGIRRWPSQWPVLLRSYSQLLNCFWKSLSKIASNWVRHSYFFTSRLADLMNWHVSVFTCTMFIHTCSSGVQQGVTFYP